MMLLYFLPVLTLITAYQGHKEKSFYNYIHSLLPKETLPYSQGMNLLCGNVSTKDVSDPPTVDWYFYEYKKYHRLNCSTFWQYEYKNDICRNGAGRYPRFEGPSSYSCILPSNSSYYVCQYSHKDIIPLKYKCVISTHTDDDYEIQKIKIIYVVDNITRDYKKWSAKPCFLPSIKYLTGTLSSNKSMTINLQFTVNKPISGCLRPHCNTTKKYKGKVVIYDSISSMHSWRKYKDGGNHRTEWAKITEGQSLFNVVHPEISLQKYYKIVLKSMTTYKKHMHREKWIKELKTKCYFDKQSPANIQHSSSRNMMEAPIGSKVNATCYATGQPLPTVKLVYEYDDRNVTLMQGMSNVVYPITVLDSYTLYCVASNTVINPAPCGEVMDSEVSTVIEIMAL